jgi:hypothetical protein
MLRAALRGSRAGFRPEAAAKVKALNLKGVYFQKEFQRFYPDSEIAAQVLGYVGIDDNGLGGMEQKFDGRLHGQPGRMYAAMDARRHVMGSTEHEPEPGENLVLTIDENIQFIAEKRSTRPCSALAPTMARLSSRMCIPARSWRLRSGRPSIPTTFATHAGTAARSCGERCLRAWVDIQAGDLRFGARSAHRQAG